MKVYFLETNSGNNVVITDGETAKVYDAAPSGIFEGIDLYSDDATEQIKNHFEKIYASGELNEYNEIYSENEVDFEDIEEELEDATLVFSSDRVSAEDIADYIINSPSMMYEDGYYYAHWSPENGLNYDGFSNLENISVASRCYYDDDGGMDRDEFDRKERLDDPDFMRICEDLAEKLNTEIDKQ